MSQRLALFSVDGQFLVRPVNWRGQGSADRGSGEEQEQEKPIWQQNRVFAPDPRDNLINPTKMIVLFLSASCCGGRSK